MGFEKGLGVGKVGGGIRRHQVSKRAFCFIKDISQRANIQGGARTKRGDHASRTT